MLLRDGWRVEWLKGSMWKEEKSEGRRFESGVVYERGGLNLC